MKVLFDPNQYKSSIQSKITERTGYVLEMPNPLTLGVFPSLGISTTDFSVKNTPHSSMPFLTADQVEVQFKLIPLLLGQLVIRDIQLEDFSLFLKVASDGTTNWMAANKKTIGKKASFDISREQISAILNKITLEAFTLKKGTFTWQDDYKNSHYVANINTFHSGNMLSNLPYDVRLEANVKNQNNKTASDMSFEAHVLPNAETEEHKIEHLRYTKSIIEHPTFKQGTQIQFLGQGLYDHAQKALSFPNFTVTTLGFEAEIPFTGRWQPEGLFFAGDIELKPAKLEQAKDYLKALPSGLVPLLKEEVALTSSWQLTPAWLTLADISAQLGQSRGEGKVTLAFDPEQLSQYQINLNKLVLSGAPRSPDNTSDAGQNAANIHANWLLPIAALGKSSGEIGISSLVYRGQALTNVQFAIETRANDFRLTRFSADAFEGTIEAELELKKVLAGYQAEAGTRVEDTLLKPILSMLDYPAPITGILSMETLLKSEAGDFENLSRNSKGLFKLRVIEGFFEGLDLKTLVQEAIEGNQTTSARAQSAEATTPFSELIAEGEYYDHRINIEKLTIAAPGWRMVGKGLVDTQAKVLNFETKLTLIKENGDVSEYQNIPFSLSGPISNPSYTLDFVRYLKKQARNRINQRMGLSGS